MTLRCIWANGKGSYRCLVPTAQYGRTAYHTVLLGGGESIVTRWFVQGLTEHIELYRFGSLRDVTPYDLWVS